MPDLSDLLRRSVAREVASYEPSAALPQRIARRTLQLQRRRRGRIVGGAAVLAVAVLAIPVVLPSRDRSNSVGVAYEPVNITARKARVTTTTTTTTVPIRLLDLQGLFAHGLEERNKALKRFAAALKKRDRDEAAKRRAAEDAAVLGASAIRSAAPGRNGSGGGTTGATSGPSTSTTKKPSTTTTDPPTTTTTNSPPPTTQPTTPIVPLVIVPPPYVCAGVPAVFHATGTGAELLVWSNLQVGSTATFTLTASTTIAVRLELTPGSSSNHQFFVQVTPTGTPPC